MKYKTLNRVVRSYVDKEDRDSEYSGGVNFSKSRMYLEQLSKIRDSIIGRLDLRPSEYHKIDEYEVNEYEVFSDIIKEYKYNLVKDIDLDVIIKLLNNEYE